MCGVICHGALIATRKRRCALDDANTRHRQFIAPAAPRLGVPRQPASSTSDEGDIDMLRAADGVAPSRHAYRAATSDAPPS